jgi:hypothetical protein
MIPEVKFMFICNHCNEIIGWVSEHAVYAEGLEAHIHVKGRDEIHNEFTTLRFPKKVILDFIEDLDLEDNPLSEVQSP